MFGTEAVKSTQARKELWQCLSKISCLKIGTSITLTVLVIELNAKNSSQYSVSTKLRFWCVYLLPFIFTSLPAFLFAQDTVDRFSLQTKAKRCYAGIDFGVGLGFKSSSLSYSNATTLVDASFAPKVGYFPVKQVLVGLSTDISNSLTVLDGQDQYGISNISFHPFVRYYFMKGIFAEGMYGIGRGKETFRGGSNDELLTNSFNSKRYSVGLGIANYWLDRCSFELLLSYGNVQGDFARLDENSPLKISGLSVKAGIGVSIGK